MGYTTKTAAVRRKWQVSRRQRQAALKEPTRALVDAVEDAVGLDDIDHIIITCDTLAAVMSDGSTWAIVRYRSAS